MDRAVKRGDLVYLNFDPIVGSEQGGPLPAVVVQNDLGNKHAPTVIIAPVTSKNKKSNLPTHVKLTSQFLERNSMVLLEQVKTIDKSRIESYIGTLTDEEMKMIDKALRISLGMGRYKKKRGK
jgi:mRNA interferase MazF